MKIPMALEQGQSALATLPCPIQQPSQDNWPRTQSFIFCQQSIYNMFYFVLSSVQEKDEEYQSALQTSSDILFSPSLTIFIGSQ